MTAMAIKHEVDCPRCGIQQLPISEIELHICTTAPDHFYTFTCPSCRKLVKQSASQAFIDEMEAFNVIITRWGFEAPKPRRRTPVVTVDDVVGAWSEDLADDELFTAGLAYLEDRP